MKTALRLFIAFSALSSVVIAAGCDDGSDGETTTTTTATTDTTTTSTNMGGMGGMGGNGGAGGSMAVMFPQIGTQIERMGRPAINTALNHTFDADMATKDAAKDAWNAAGMAEWTTYVGEVALNLGILDSLDATCGNQLLADNAAGADRYLPLAGILADDRLWVKLDGVTCAQYLGVEAGLNDCGGRRLTDDVIDRSYSVLSAGQLVFIGDTIDADPAKTSGTTFPYLADPL